MCERSSLWVAVMSAWWQTVDKTLDLNESENVLSIRVLVNEVFFHGNDTI
jgi:hypothetical protein